MYLAVHVKYKSETNVRMPKNEFNDLNTVQEVFRV